MSFIVCMFYCIVLVLLLIYIKRFILYINLSCLIESDICESAVPQTSYDGFLQQDGNLSKGYSEQCLVVYKCMYKKSFFFFFTVVTQDLFFHQNKNLENVFSSIINLLRWKE